MFGFPETLERLVRLLSTLPGVGRKSATRIALKLMDRNEPEVRELARTLVEARRRTLRCSVCGAFTEDEVCSICRDQRRDASLICVVERPSDVLAIERTGRYRGRYHVLGGLLSPLDGVGPEDLRMDTLIERARGGELSEAILALNPTTEGEATALYIGRLLTPHGVRVTRPASGLPVGGELDLADELTLGTALDERRDMRE
ncbi:MAG: recombination protein RecR [Candidatus Eisenbacteria bacterium]|nr:recombination protein RecR [Candidatus Eisenbacteria bacterium]